MAQHQDAEQLPELGFLQRVRLSVRDYVGQPGEGMVRDEQGRVARPIYLEKETAAAPVAALEAEHAADRALFVQPHPFETTVDSLGTAGVAAAEIVQPLRQRLEREDKNDVTTSVKKLPGGGIQVKLSEKLPPAPEEAVPVLPPVSESLPEPIAEAAVEAVSQPDPVTTQAVPDSPQDVSDTVHLKLPKELITQGRKISLTIGGSDMHSSALIPEVVASPQQTATTETVVGETIIPEPTTPEDVESSDTITVQPEPAAEEPQGSLLAAQIRERNKQGETKKLRRKHTARNSLIATGLAGALMAGALVFDIGPLDNGANTSVAAGQDSFPTNPNGTTAPATPEAAHDTTPVTAAKASAEGITNPEWYNYLPKWMPPEIAKYKDQVVRTLQQAINSPDGRFGGQLVTTQKNGKTLGLLITEDDADKDPNTPVVQRVSHDAILKLMVLVKEAQEKGIISSKTGLSGLDHDLAEKYAPALDIRQYNPNDPEQAIKVITARYLDISKVAIDATSGDAMPSDADIVDSYSLGAAFNTYLAAKMTAMNNAWGQDTNPVLSEKG